MSRYLFFCSTYSKIIDENRTFNPCNIMDVVILQSVIRFYVVGKDLNRIIQWRVKTTSTVKTVKTFLINLSKHSFFPPRLTLNLRANFFFCTSLTFNRTRLSEFYWTYSSWFFSFEYLYLSLLLGFEYYI